MRKIYAMMLGIFLCLITGVTVMAQETTSEIVGSVTANQAPIEGATITVIHTPTGTKYVTTTRKGGRFNIPGLRVGGPYVVTASYVGYADETHDGIIISLGQAYEGDFVLKPAASQLASVVVTSTRQNSVFNNNHTGNQQIITRDQLEKLPTINRSIQDFTRLEPTATNNGGYQSFGGNSGEMNNITVDGANFNNGFGLSPTLGGQAGAQPISLEAIDQVQVNVSPYDVRQGGFTGAGINSVTKSGTNTFKGSVYTYLKGPGTQGYNVEDVTVARSPFNFYIRGASLGGPIIKNKLFFFGSYEEVKQTAPAYTVVGSTSSLAASPGSVSQANADTLTALSNFLQKQFGYNPGSFQNYSFSTASKKVTARVDWTIDRKSTLTLTFHSLSSYSEQPQSTSRSGSGFVKGPAYVSYTYGLPFSGSKYLINNNFDIYLAELNTRFSKNFSNKLQAGYTRERDPRAPGVPGTTMPMVDILNGSGNTYGTQVYTSFGFETYTYNNLINTDVYQASDIATLYEGKHEITFGTQDYYRNYTDAFAPNYIGGYQFPSLQAFYTAAMGGPAVDKYFQEWSNIPGGPFPFYSAGSTELGVFAQDKWKATRNFTLTYGLRYDMTIYKQEYLDNPDFDNLHFKNGASYNIGKAPGNAVILSPRIGFNWDIKGDRTMQLRGGFGIFSGPPPFVWLANQPGNNGVLIGSGNFTNVPFSSNVLATPPTPAGTTTPPSKITPAYSYSAAVTAPNFKYPTIMKMGVGFDKKFPEDWVLSIELAGSKDINAVYFSNLNLNESNAITLAGADNRLRYINPAVPNSTKYYYGNANSDPTNPNLGTAILLANTNKGYAYTYTARIQKTFQNGLYFSLAYTYSQAKNVATGGSTASTLWAGRYVGNADPNAPNLSYADYYQPHRVIGFARYTIPYAKHFATSFGAIFEAAPAGVGSYTYGGDLNGDGNSGNDLIYVPRNSSEINLVKVGSGGSGTGASTDPRTPGQIWTQLNNFINQDHYLSSHRGQYVQANGVVFPFYKKLDLNITQDVYFFTKDGENKDKHTLRLSLDLINAGNFFNRNWGLVKQQTTSTPLTFEGMAADGRTPSFSFPYIDPNNQVPLTNSYTNNTGITSRWQMQFGIKYLFN